MGFENVGKVWKPSELATYLGTIKKPSWAQYVTFHHTWRPSLAQRPNGFTQQHIKNLHHFYKNPSKDPPKKAWSSGPHLFVDDDQCWGMCDFREFGNHAKAFNKNAIGIEVLGDYDTEPFSTGRGLECWQTAAAAAKAIYAWIEVEPSMVTVKIHRDDPKAGKSCPGENIERDWILEQIKNAVLK